MGKPIPIFRLKKAPVEIILLGDVHYGSGDCHEERFLKTVNYIMSHKNTYCILMGDLCEMVTRSQSGDQILQQKKNPTDQVKDMERILMPLAKKGKILSYLRDNHVQRLEREALLDLNDILATHLNIPYLGVGGIIQIYVGNKLYKIVAQHGKDAGKNEFVKLDEMLLIYPNCDIYVLAHNHRLSARKVVQMCYDSNNEESGKEVWQIRSGSYLRYAQYARERLYRPSVIGSPIIIFKENGHIAVDIETLSWGQI